MKKDIKIVVKCKGLSVRTNDLEMGLGILDQIAKHGIMNHSFISNKLLDKASDIIEAASTKLAGLGIIRKVQENFKMPEFTPTEEAVVEEPKQITNKGYKARAWTIDEDKLVCDLRDTPVHKVIKNKTLLKNHTVNAIKTRLCIYRKGHLDRLGSDRGKLMKAYLSGEKVETPVANIRKPELKPTKKGLNKQNPEWSDVDVQLLQDNIDLPVKKLEALFPGRTRAGINARRTKLKKSLGLPPKKKGTSWTKEEVDAIRLNMNMKPKELAELPWLKNRSIGNISNMKWQLKHGKYNGDHQS